MPEVQKKILKIYTPRFLNKKWYINMQSKCPVCGIKKSRFVKEQEARGLLSNLGIKKLLSQIPLLNVLF